MILTEFSEKTFPRTTGRGAGTVPKVSFTKVGTITFNKAACDLIGIKPNEKVSLAQDTKSAKDWYVYLDSKHGYAARLASDKKGCIIQHTGLVRKFKECFSLGDKTDVLVIAGLPTVVEKVKYWCILINKEPE